MRRRIITFLLIAVGGTLVPAARATTSAPPDWTVLVVTAGPAGATDVIVESEHGFTRAGRVATLGAAIAQPADHVAGLDLFPLGGDRFSASTTRTLGGHKILLATTSHQRNVTMDFLLGSLAPNETMNLLVFAAGGDFRNAGQTISHFRSGQLTVHSVSGHGSGQWVLANPNDGGVGAAAGGTAAGVNVAHHVRPSASIVGAFAPFHTAGAQRLDWRSPDGRSGRLTSVSAPSAGRGSGTPPSFLGPAGPWTFSWTGAIADRQPQALAAWASIGRYWTLFNQPVLF